MLKTDQIVRMYEDLAHIYDRQGQHRLRDWFLILAADAAYSAGWENEAERLRSQLLSYNPHHLLKPFASFAEALQSNDIQNYIADLRRSYPPETAEQMLENHRPSYLTSAREEIENNKKEQEPAKPSNGEEPKIYRLEKEKTESEPASSSPAPAKSALPARPAVSKRSTLAKKRKPSPLVSDWNSKPAGSSKSPAAGDKDLLEDVNTASRLVVSALFLLVLLLGLALLFYLLVRPFFPMPGS